MNEFIDKTTMVVEDMLKQSKRLKSISKEVYVYLMNDSSTDK